MRFFSYVALFFIGGIVTSSASVYYLSNTLKQNKFKDLREEVENFYQKFDNLFNEIKEEIINIDEKDDIKKFWLNYFLKFHSKFFLNPIKEKKIKVVLKKINEIGIQMIRKSQLISEVFNSLENDLKILKEKIKKSSLDSIKADDIYRKINIFSEMSIKKQELEEKLETEQKILIDENFKKLEKILKDDAIFKNLKIIYASINHHKERIFSNEFSNLSEDKKASEIINMELEITKLHKEAEKILKNKKYRKTYEKIKNIFYSLLQISDDEIKTSNLINNNFYISLLDIANI